MSELMMSSPHNFPFLLYTEIKIVTILFIQNIWQVRLWHHQLIISKFILMFPEMSCENLQKIKIVTILFIQNIWQVRLWHHQLNNFQIHIDVPRNVLWKFAKLQSVITSVFFNRFSSNFQFCLKMCRPTLSSEIKLNVLQISPLIFFLLLHHTAVKILFIMLFLALCVSRGLNEGHQDIHFTSLLHAVE